jgi:hypothetical protein
VDAVVMPGVRFFTDRKIPGWIRELWTPGNPKITAALSEEESSKLLMSFVDIPEVDHHTVRMLISVGERYPKLVLDFFSSRIRRDRTQTSSRFDPIPFHGHDLPQFLSRHSDLLLTAIRGWYEEDPRFHEYRGGRLFKHAFPQLTEEVSDKLIELAREGSETDFKFVLKTLAPFEGDEAIYPICMEVVERLEPGAKLLTRVSQVLGETGVLIGEFGHVDAYRQRRDLINRWRDDARPRVQAFARARARELEQSMAWEQRRAERDVAQRRRDWDEP